MKKHKKKIFISAPISGFGDDLTYKKFREFILKLIVLLRCYNFDVCSELELISHDSDYDNPTKSIENDFEKIKSSDIFLMVHPQKMQTSSLMELGFACAFSKKIIIVGNKTHLPYLAQGLESSNLSAHILDVKKIDDSIMPKILKLII